MMVRGLYLLTVSFWIAMAARPAMAQEFLRRSVPAINNESSQPGCRNGHLRPNSACRHVIGVRAATNCGRRQRVA